jgi:hypothetical protein
MSDDCNYSNCCKCEFKDRKLIDLCFTEILGSYCKKGNDIFGSNCSDFKNESLRENNERI